MKVTSRARCLAATAPLIVAFLAMPFLASTSYADEHRHDCDLKGFVLFSLQQFDYIGNLEEEGQFRADASGGHVAQLTPLISNDIYQDARWSPDGQNIVYEYTTYTANLVTPTQLYRANRDGSSVQQITSGPGPKYGPAWSKTGWIAFINGLDENGCLWVVRPNGREQHLLFCPNLSQQFPDNPVWSHDGKSIYFMVSWMPPLGLEPPIYNNLYKIDVDTGMATLILSWNTTSPPSQQLSSDGKYTVYTELVTGSVQLINNASGKVVTQFPGSQAVWSKDGKHLAYTQVVSVPGTHRTFGELFVMDADGSHVRSLTPNLVANEFFTPADWSDDGMHIVINDAYNVQTVEIIDVNTRAITQVAEGIADYDSWTGSH
jgi:Tol biopolymer transport system component